MKVNMTPNPLDVVTIHASQGDTEARQWEFELHNNGELIDTSDVKEQLVFKAYKGGTEQLLPENGSTPTTSPFKGDIKYPQGLLTDQEFTYRQSPTEEDGLAKITEIKGNTLGWNQLVDPKTESVTNNGITYTLGSNGEIIANGTPTANSTCRYANSNISFISGHKYLLMGCPSGGGGTKYRLWTESSVAFPVGSRLEDIGNGIIKTASGNENIPKESLIIQILQSNGAVSNLKFRPQIFDLTKMGLDSITSADEFTSLFPLPYYAYNQGSLLSFMGNGIKTVGFNQWDEEWEVGAYNSADGSKADNVRDRIRNKNPIRIFPSVNYYKNKGLQVYYYDASMNFIGWNSLNNPGIFTIPSNAYYINFNGIANSGIVYNNDICINISDTERNGTYEPYTSSTLSLPISTYFPNGMKSAGSVYDELTESKAITRIGAVDLGSLAWLYRESGSVLAPYFYASFNGIKSQGAPAVNKANILCSKYQTVKRDVPYFVDKTICADGIPTVLSQIQIKDSSFTDATAFKNSLQGQYLYYELATPTETSFTTASLVTENAEIPLSNNDGVLLGKCTEELSENPGFIDAKIKLSDADGECYSNKIQLHVERSPQ